MELEEGYDKRGTSGGTSGGTCYTVEARYNSHEPKEFGGQIFDNRWRQVNFARAAIGVPAGNRALDWVALEHGYLGYAAAQALRWWFHAHADAEGFGGGLCLETRLVKHKYSVDYKIEPTSAHEHIHGEDRSNCIPDWGEKP